jgi:hypothetical protein
LYLLIAFLVVPTVGSFAQTTTFFGPCPTSLTSGTTNQGKLICQFPFSGTLLAQLTFGSSGPIFNAEASAAFKAATSINAAVAAQLTQLPVPSATIGVIQIRRKGSDIPAPFTNLGPILTDRPDTVGRGHVFGEFAFQHFNFNKLDGFGLSSLPLAFSYTDAVGSTADPKIHYGSMSNDISFQMDQYIFVATGGITGTTDVSVVVPVNNVQVKVAASNFSAFDYDINTHSYFSHNPPANTPPLISTGTASGLGDIIVGVKQMVIGQDHLPPAVAVGATFRFPTGDSFNYLGSGAMGGTIYGLAEYRAKLAPHFKVAYVWNDNTKILSTDLQSGGTRLPGGLSYALGADYRLNPKVTLSADLIGNQFINAPYFNQTSQPLNPAPTTPGVPANFNNVAPIPNTYTTTSFSGGVKWSPIPHMVVYGNALVQLNDVGLRSDVVPLVGIAYNYKRTPAR